MDICVRRAQQHQEKRSVCLVSGTDSAAFRAVHDDLPFFRTNAPSPHAATLLQEGFKDRQSVWHCYPSFARICSLSICRQIPLRVQTFKKICLKPTITACSLPVSQSKLHRNT